MIVAPQEIRIELLLGTSVVDSAGRRIGRIQEFTVTGQGGQAVITDYVVGVAGFFERLSASALGQWFRRALGLAPVEPWRIPWQALDFSNPERPCLRISREELLRARATLPRTSKSRVARRARPRTR